MIELRALPLPEHRALNMLVVPIWIVSSQSSEVLFANAAAERLSSTSDLHALRHGSHSAHAEEQLAAAWPAVRDGYLLWLQAHERDGVQFERAEVWREQMIGAVKLVGKIDRMDRQANGLTLVLDYKSEDLSKTKQRRPCW